MEAEQPQIVQIGQEAVFTFEPDNGQCLACEGCGRPLVIGYSPKMIIDVGFVCPTCGHATSTALLYDGDMMPQNGIVLLRNGRKYGCHDLHVKGETVLVSDRARDHEKMLLGPRWNSEVELTLDNEGLERIVRLYDKLTGGGFDQQMRWIARTHDHPRGYMDKTFAWSIWKLRDALVRDLDITISTTLRLALQNISGFCHVAHIWGNHPQFSAIARTLRDGAAFRHTITQMITAAPLWEDELRVGIAPPIGEGGRLADLFLQATPAQKLHIEVKAPKVLNGPGAETIGETALLRTIEGVLKSAKGQISTLKLGILMLSVEAVSENRTDYIKTCCESLLERRGGDHTGVAGMIIVSRITDLQFVGVASKTMYNVNPILNPRFPQPNPVAIGPRPDFDPRAFMAQ